MNRFFLFLCFLFLTNLLYSQCYEPMRKDGITFYNRGEYPKAINCFMAAQRCPDKPATHDLNKWIADCNAKINAVPTTSKTQSQVCYVPILKAAQVSFFNDNFVDAKGLFIEARKCSDLPVDNELAFWIKICDDQLEFLDCIAENYTPFYLKGNEFFRRGDFEKSKENYLLASQSECIPNDLDVYVKIAACDQKIREKRFNTLLHDTISVNFWGKEGVFMGHVQFNKPNGKGLLLFTKDPVFKSIEGDFKNGEPIGTVHCIFNNHDEFTGTLKDDGFEIGTYKYANGDIYDGSFNQRVPNGEGTMRYTNGDVYTGRMVNGKKEGIGKLTVKSGYIANAQGATAYEGIWSANQKGFGKCYDDKGVLIHEGVFINDFPEKDYPNRVMRISFTWVEVPAGTFTMGCTSLRDCTGRDRPARTVTLSEFQISDKQVTVAQYRTFCEATGRSMPTRPSWGWEDDHPIVNVTWNDAVAFCQWTNCRLPTEAEWEYAAQGAIEPRQKLYSGSNNLREVGYFMDNTSRVRSVGQKKPNELLIYDMSGNVSEWVSDWFDVYPQGAQKDPQGASQGTHRVVRGGNWFSSEEECRITYRGICEPHLGNTYLGFRVVRN
ncbi:MAG: SUMF1/EgtB/PvdO family nonheme iron enzyme [Bacteroidetes bacterium]|nr:SUMF1/EgtB/PvdO family nonheme iron enzyme [Bacteroidota bacterium]MCL2302096.1 SUMF1/EgtB/PvdO family nonheme iron enzyme [Lentimicrobiaceae bacterium]